MPSILTTAEKKALKELIVGVSLRYTNIRIHSDEVHGYAEPMPNTNSKGWVFLGYLQDYKSKGLYGLGLF